jgi:hypothetical protein
MLSFHLEDPATGTCRHFEARRCLRVTRTSLHAEEDETLASFRGGLWLTPEGKFGVLAVDSAVRVVFQGGEPSQVYGPFERVLVVGGMLRYGAERNDHLARLDDQDGVWEVLWDHNRYPTVIFSPS